MKTLSTIAIILFSGAVLANPVYHCGNTYTDKPCGHAITLNVNASTPTVQQTLTAETRLNAEKQFVAQLVQQRQTQEMIDIQSRAVDGQNIVNGASANYYNSLSGYVDSRTVNQKPLFHDTTNIETIGEVLNHRAKITK